MNDFNRHSSIYSLGNSKAFLSSADFEFKINFCKNSARDTIRVVKGLYQDQDRCSVGTDLGSLSLYIN